MLDLSAALEQPDHTRRIPPMTTPTSTPTTIARPTITPPAITLPNGDGELWWGGAVADGCVMPFGASGRAHRDLATNAGFAHKPEDGANQSAPLLISNRGHVVWSERPFTFTITPQEVTLEPGIDGAPLEISQAGEHSLRAAFLAATTHFAPTGATPAIELFTGPQYNTWIEMPWLPTQEAVLAYARRILDSGLPPGVLMIDDNWAPDFGDWQFDTRRFPDAAAMIEELHALGFHVMVWIVPFVSPDSAISRDLAARDLLLKDRTGAVAIRQWWNGYSAVLDVTNPAAIAYLDGELRGLMAATGVDGFKFDAGDLRDYVIGDQHAVGTLPTDPSQAWALFGATFGFNEFRASWKVGGQHLAQRLHDKPTTWEALRSLIPEGIAQSLTGHAFICPDMIGGGDVGAFAGGAAVEQEHFVRYAQVAALFPMTQFSLSPARVLDAEHFAAVRSALDLRAHLLPEILALVEHAARTGEPILRPLGYHYPGLEHVNDQFLLGENILVAPIQTKGATERRVVIPPGQWRAIEQHSETQAPDGEAHLPGNGVLSNTIVTLPVTLTTLPTYRRIG